MAELKFPVTELEKDKFQVKVDMALYAKESLAAACYKLTDRFYVHQQTDGENIVVVFESKDGNTITEETVKQFCNELIDQQSLALQHLFNSFLIHRFCAKVATPDGTTKPFSKSQGIPGLFNTVRHSFY